MNDLLYHCLCNLFVFYVMFAVQAIKARKKRSKAKNRHKNVENRCGCCADSAIKCWNYIWLR